MDIHHTNRWQSTRVEIGTLYLDDAVVIGDPTGVLVLRRTDGSTLLDKPAPPGTSGDFLFFDSGTFEAMGGGVSCKGAAKGAHFIATCGDRILFFNQHWLALFATGPY